MAKTLPESVHLWSTSEDLTRAEKPDHPFADADRDRCFRQAKRALDRTRLLAGVGAAFGDRLQAARTRALATGQECAKPIFVLLAVKREAEEFDGTQSQGQAGSLTEGSFELAVFFRIPESFKKLPVLSHVNVISKGGLCLHALRLLIRRVPHNQGDPVTVVLSLAYDH